MSHKTFEDEVSEACAGLRLDVYLAAAIEDVSRSFVQKLVKEGRVAVNGHECSRSSRLVNLGDRVAVEIPPPPAAEPIAEDIPLDIVYQDAEVLVVNKPTGLVVHPAPGHYTGTLVNAVLFHCPDFQRPGSDLTRPGIVHRLDRFTSGLIVVAKTQRAFLHLSEQAREHQFDRRYLALVQGEFREDRGRINVPVGRSLSDPGRMTVTGIKGRDAVTSFEVLERFRVASLLGLVLETGRTHQIRVHLRYTGRPVLGDPVYGTADYSGWKIPPSLRTVLEALPGQALHAERLGFTHPATHEPLCFTAPLPQEFQAALDALRAFPG